MGHSGKDEDIKYISLATRDKKLDRLCKKDKLNLIQKRPNFYMNWNDTLSSAAPSIKVHVMLWSGTE